MKTLRVAQRGMTLIELLVGLAIGLVITLAASMLYLQVSQSSRANKAVSDINETGKLVLDLLGRELQKAGFYPAEYASATQSKLAGVFSNGKSGAHAAFDSGVFGCLGANYDPTTQACATPVPGAPDSIVMNYYATPEFGAGSLTGNANDCNRRPVGPVAGTGGDADNVAAAAANMPLFVSNRFGLSPVETYTDANGAQLRSRSLWCHGNGDDTKGTFDVHLQGVEDMVISYGLYATADSQSPTTFGTAADVAGGWSRVVAVRICIVARSMDNGRVDDKTGSIRTYRNCRGQNVSMPTGDRYIYKRFERVFAVRNNLTVPL